MVSDGEPAASSVNTSVIHKQEDTNILAQSFTHEETAGMAIMIDDGADCDVYSYRGDYDVYDQGDSQSIVGEQDVEDDLDNNATDDNYTNRDNDKEGEDDDEEGEDDDEEEDDD